MRSLLHQLENNEAVLLLYLADELPPADRAEVEQMLSTDGGLRAELERLRLLVADFETEMAALDAGSRPLTRADVAARRVGRSVGQWQAARAARRAAAVAADAARASGNGPRWGYALAAAAACATITAAVWWAAGPDPSVTPPGVGFTAETQPLIDPSPSPELLAQGERLPFLAPFDDEAEAPAPIPPETAPATDGARLAAAGGGTAWTDRFDALERDLYALSADAGSATFFTDPTDADPGTPDGF